MSRMVKASLDSKGRIVVPLEFRNILRLGIGADVFVQLDEDNERITVSPATGRNAILTIELSDAPGSLAKAAKILFENGVDLITTESRATARGKTAEWRVVGNVLNVKDMGALKQKLLDAGGAKSVKISKI